MCYNGIEVDALGALNAVGHMCRIIMVKPGCDAVTVSAAVPAWSSKQLGEVQAFEVCTYHEDMGGTASTLFPKTSLQKPP